MLGLQKKASEDFMEQQLGSAGTSGNVNGQAVQSRFGEVTVQPERAVKFSKGLLGMGDKTVFCLTDFPMEQFARFKLLQSLEDEKLAFITLPIDIKNDIVERKDLEEAANSLDIPLSELVVLLIATVHRRSEGVSLSVNARAPLMVHAKAKTGTQYVFAHNRYNIRHNIAMQEAQ